MEDVTEREREREREEMWSALIVASVCRLYGCDGNGG